MIPALVTVDHIHFQTTIAVYLPVTGNERLRESNPEKKCKNGDTGTMLARFLWMTSSKPMRSTADNCYCAKLQALHQQSGKVWITMGCKQNTKTRNRQNDSRLVRTDCDALRQSTLGLITDIHVRGSTVDC